MASTIQPFLCDTFGTELAREWLKWKRNFGYFVEFNAIVDAERKKKLLLLLAGAQVQEVFENLNDDAKETGPRVSGYGTVDVYQAAVEKLDGYFASTINVTVERHLFNQMKQDHGESMEKFVMKLRTQAKRCDFGEQTNSCIRDRLIAGCASIEFRREMLKKVNATLDDVMIQAKILEAVDVHSKAFKTENNPPVAVNKIVESKICSRCGRSSHTEKNSCPALEKQCFQCGKTGHFKSKCRSGPAANNNKNFGKRNPKNGPNNRFQPYQNQYRNRNTDNNKNPNNNHSATENNSNNVNRIEQNEDTQYIFCITGAETNRIHCRIGGIPVELVIDSGSKLNIIDTDSWNRLKVNRIKCVNMTKGTDQSFKAYGDNPLDVMGMVDAELEIGTQKEVVRFYVVQQKGLPLLGLESAVKFGILKIEKPVPISSVAAIEAKKPLNKIKGIQIELDIDPNVTPVWQPYRRIPVPLEEAVNEKLDELLAQDIIEPVEGHSSWVSPMVVVLKDKDQGKPEVRLCIDMRKANQAIRRENHPLPIINDLLPHLAGAKIFSKMDIRQAFHQVELSPKSRYITTFITKKGLFRYKRLMFGISCAPEKYQKMMDRIVGDLEGVLNAADDLLVHAKTMEEHDGRLEKLMERLTEYNILLNLDKCVFRVTQIRFLGHILTEEGIKPNPRKIEAIKNFNPPNTVELVRSFLGMVTFLGQYIPNLATISNDLRILLKKDAEFIWGPKQQKAFDELKSKLTSEVVLGYFDICDRTVLYVDASPVGLGAVLVQFARSGPNQGKPRAISYASKSLSETEKRYCQTEKEALALVWGVEHNHYYLYGRCFELVTDHKPLEVIFGPNSRPCARIERWVLRLQSYKYTIVYRSGKSNIADPLSRLCRPGESSFDENSEHYVNFVTQYSVPKSFQLTEIAAAARCDEEILEVKKALNSNRSDDSKWAKLEEMDGKNKIYRMSAIEFSFAGDILLRSTRLVMPRELRKRTLQLAHEGHPGMTEMKKRIRSKVWWPGIDTDVEETVRNCRSCILVAAPNMPEPLKRTELPNGPWQVLALDFLGPIKNSINVLVVTDYYSRWNEIEFMRKIETSLMIMRLRIIFARFGIPLAVKCDNGPQFTAIEFIEFCRSLNIKILHTTPYSPQQNGLVERQNRSLLKILRISEANNGDLEKDLLDYLLMYRTTVHPATGKTPAELLMGRNIRDKLPQIEQNEVVDEAVEENDRLYKEKGKVVQWKFIN